MKCDFFFPHGAESTVNQEILRVIFYFVCFLFYYNYAHYTQMVQYTLYIPSFIFYCILL